MKRTQVVGMVLWRGGLLVLAAAAAIEAVRALMRYFDLPLQLELGSAMFGGGVLLVILSMILERARDARTEGDLGQ